VRSGFSAAIFCTPEPSGDCRRVSVFVLPLPLALPR
jgi:hypothetical protein